MSIKISVLGSGSRGNATFIGTPRVRLLIDCGLGPRNLRKRLSEIGEEPESLDAVLVTHEHTDHIGGLGPMLKLWPVGAYMSPGTIEKSRTDRFEMNGSAIIPIAPGRPFAIRDLDVEPFAVPHDAEDPVGYSVTYEGIKVTQLTDLGWIPETVADSIAGSDVLIIESNHDLEMLRAGSYPWSLKERLMSREGHLSNTAVARFLSGAYDGHAQKIVLAHLSAQNNHPEIARQEACRALEGRRMDPSSVVLAHQDQPTAPIELG